MNGYLVTFMKVYPNDKPRVFSKHFAKLGNARNFIAQLAAGREAKGKKKAWDPISEHRIRLYDLSPAVQVPLDFGRTSNPEPQRSRGDRFSPGRLANLLAERLEPGEVVKPVRDVAHFYAVRHKDAQEAFRLMREDPRFEPSDRANPRSPLRRKDDALDAVVEQLLAQYLPGDCIKASINDAGVRWICETNDQRFVNVRNAADGPVIVRKPELGTRSDTAPPE